MWVFDFAFKILKLKYKLLKDILIFSVVNFR